MNLHKLLGERAEAAAPVRVGLIGAGKFGSMYLAQARRSLDELAGAGGVHGGSLRLEAAAM